MEDMILQQTVDMEMVKVFMSQSHRFMLYCQLHTYIFLNWLL